MTILLMFLLQTLLNILAVIFSLILGYRKYCTNFFGLYIMQNSNSTTIKDQWCVLDRQPFFNQIRDFFGSQHNIIAAYLKSTVELSFHWSICIIVIFSTISTSLFCIGIVRNMTGVSFLHK